MYIKDKKWVLIASNCFLALSLVSCGGGGGENDDTPNNNNPSTGTKLGIVTVGISSNEVELDATFLQSSIVISESQLRADLKPSVLDVCSVTTFNTEIETPPRLEGNLSALSAGNTLQFSEPVGGLFAEINKQTILGFTTYIYDDNNGNNPLLGPIPDDLSISIPGDQFASFSNVSVPNIEPLTSASPAIFAPVTVDTDFTWDAPLSDSSFIEISFISFGANNLYIECLVVDDGLFSFSQSTKDELSGAGFTQTFGVDFVRKEVNFVKQGDDYLVIESQATN